MMNYLMLIFSAILLAVNFCINKLYQKQAGTSLKVGFLFSALSGLCSAIIFFALNGFQASFSVYSIVMVICQSVLSMSYTLLGFRILKDSNMALYTLFLMTGGMTIPYLWGLLFLDEPFSWLRTAGLAVLICAVALSNVSKQRPGVKQLLMCVGVFILNGFVSVVSKLHQIQTGYPTVSTIEFVMYNGVVSFLIAGIAFLVCIARENSRNRSETPCAKKPVILPLIAVSAIIGGVSYMIQLLGAKNLPATVLYPFLTGGSMICSTLAGIVIFREKPPKSVIISVCLCFVGTLMFL